MPAHTTPTQGPTEVTPLRQTKGRNIGALTPGETVRTERHGGSPRRSGMERDTP